MQFGFMFIALIWKFDFSPFMVLIIAILNDGKANAFSTYSSELYSSSLHAYEILTQ